MEEKKYPNPGVAAVLSFLFTGLGQLYNGQITKGLTLISVSGVSILLFIIGAALTAYSIFGVTGFRALIVGLVLIILSILVIAIAGIYNIYDAYNTAKKS